MKIIDSTPFNRSLTLASNEQLDSSFIIAALVEQGIYDEGQAIDAVGYMFDALECALLEQRTAA